MASGDEQALWQARGAIRPEIVPDGSRRSVDRKVLPFVRDGETFVTASKVIPVVAASGGGVGALGMVGEGIARRGAVAGESDSIARLIPYQTHCVLGVFSDRIGLYTLGGFKELWSAPRSAVARVEKRPRLQVLARMRLHFEDGSRADFYLTSGKRIKALAAAIGAGATVEAAGASA